MIQPKYIAIVSIVLLVSLAVAPGAALAQPDECMNAEQCPDNGPPGFVADLVPDFLSDLIGNLPVPNLVKGFFGATPC